MTKYLLSRLTNTTAWVGIIGLILLAFHLTDALAVLFILLFVLPEKNFTELFSGWTQGIKETLDEVDKK